MPQPEEFFTPQPPSADCDSDCAERNSNAPQPAEIPPAASDADSPADSPANCAAEHSAAERPAAVRGRGHKKLSNQIERIRKAKSAADRLCKNAKMDAAMASVEILWEILFDYLSSNPELDEDGLASVSGIAQKLASSRTQLANFESKISTIAASSDSPESKTGSLSEETVAKIESALKLL